MKPAPEPTLNPLVFVLKRRHRRFKTKEQADQEPVAEQRPQLAARQRRRFGSTRHERRGS